MNVRKAPVTPLCHRGFFMNQMIIPWRNTKYVRQNKRNRRLYADLTGFLNIYVRELLEFELFLFVFL